MEAINSVGSHRCLRYVSGCVRKALVIETCSTSIQAIFSMAVLSIVQISALGKAIRIGECVAIINWARCLTISLKRERTVNWWMGDKGVSGSYSS